MFTMDFSWIDAVVGQGSNLTLLRVGLLQLYRVPTTMPDGVRVVLRGIGMDTAQCFIEC